MSNIDNLVNKYNKEKEKVEKQVQKEFIPVITDLLAKSDLIESIGWTQYTPYFNDGEPCTFDVNTYDLLINGDWEYETEELNETIYKEIETEEELQSVIEENERSGRTENSWYKQPVIGTSHSFPNDSFNSKEHDLLEEIKKVIQSVPDEIMESMFGDHVKVTIFKDGTTETEEYDHH